MAAGRALHNDRISGILWRMKRLITAGLPLFLGIAGRAADPAPPPAYTPAEVNALTVAAPRQVFPLNGIFAWRDDPRRIGERERWFESDTPFAQTARVPGALQTQGLRPDYADEYRGQWTHLGRFADRIPPGWYRRDFTLPWPVGNARIWLKFGGAHPGARVWLNDRPVGAHRGAFIPFEFDVTALVRADGETNTLAVELIEDTAARALGGHYNKYGGLWSGLFRGVELERRPAVWIADAFLRADATGTAACARVTIRNDSAAPFAGALSVAIGPTGRPPETAHFQIVALPAGGAAEYELVMAPPRARAWSPDDPFLYTARVSLQQTNALVDARDFRFGLRRARADGARILLNETPLYLRGYGDIFVFPETFAPAVDRDYYRRRFRLARDCGFNFVRFHSHVPTPECLDAADEVGLCVQIEPAAIGQWSQYNDFPARAANWADAIRAARNHPCVLTYCMGNEGYAQFDDKEQLRAAARALDPDRFIIATAHHEGGANSPNIPLSDLLESNHDGHRDKPYFRHEYGHWSSLPDPAAAGRFAAFSNGTPFWIAATAARLAEHGLAGLADTLVVHSRRAQAATRKYGIERFRIEKEWADGYTLWLGPDSQYTMGLWDDFGQLKGVTPEEFRRSNGATVVLTGSDDRHRTFFAGRVLDTELAVHHTGPAPLRDGRLCWSVDGPAGTIATGAADCVDLAPGAREIITEARARLPDAAAPAALTLAARLETADGVFSNDWKFWLFPFQPLGRVTADRDIRFELRRRGELRLLLHQPGFSNAWRSATAETLLVTDTFTDRLAAHLERGGRALLLARDIFPAVVKEAPDERVRSKWATSLAASSYFGARGHIFGTVITDHPALGAFPHAGFCDFNFAGLLRDAPAIILDAAPVAIAPIIRGIDYYETGRSLGYLFETWVGPGRLLVTSFTFDPDQPECHYLLNSLLRYASGPEFQPATALDAAQLKRFARAAPPEK